MKPWLSTDSVESVAHVINKTDMEQHILMEYPPCILKWKKNSAKTITTNVIVIHRLLITVIYARKMIAD